MKQVEWRDEQHMLFKSANQAFNQQTTVITYGAPLDCGTMRSRIIHPVSAGVALQEKELDDFRNLRVLPAILGQVARMVNTRDRHAILYCFFHYRGTSSNANRVIDGLILSTGQEEGWRCLNTWFVNSQPEGVDVLFLAREYICESGPYKEEK